MLLSGLLGWVGTRQTSETVVSKCRFYRDTFCRVPGKHLTQQVLSKDGKVFLVNPLKRCHTVFTHCVNDILPPQLALGNKQAMPKNTAGPCINSQP